MKKKRLQQTKKFVQNKEASSEEWYTMHWLEELKQNGYVYEYYFQPTPFILFNGLTISTVKNYKIVEKSLLKPRIYTADYLVHWTEKAEDIFISMMVTSARLNITVNKPELLIARPFGLLEGLNFFEVKASNFRSPDERYFLSRTQFQVFEKFEEFVNLVKPLQLFEKTFVPKSLLEGADFIYQRGYKKGESKLDFNHLTLDEYVKKATSKTTT